MAWSMLKQKGLPHSLQGVAVSRTMYFLNKCPIKKLENKVPKEVQCAKKPAVKHLRVFRSKCYKHVSNAKRSKLQDKSEAMILVSYHSIGAYRLYNPIRKKISISIYVVIYEIETWNWADTTESSKHNGVVVFEDEVMNARDEAIYFSTMLQQRKSQVQRALK